jgi:hypothetical protein
VEEFVWRKPAIQLYLNITSIDIVIITNLNHFLESKAESCLMVYKNLRRKKKFFYSKKLDKSFSPQLGHRPSVSWSSQKGFKHWSQSITGISVIA